MLDVSLTKSVLTFFHEMAENGISLVYLGEFNQEITKMFTAMADDDMDRKGKERSSRKKVYHVMVETLQNMHKHADSISDSRIGKGMFIIGQKDNTYYIITSNKIKNTQVASLQSTIHLINHSTREDLKKMYMRQIKEGRLSNKGGAGLGLIDIARKTGRKYQYQFLPIDDDFCFFMLKVEIELKKGEKSKSSLPQEEDAC